MAAPQDTFTNSLAFLNRGGEMGELLRSYDWTEFALGTTEKWCPTLKATVGILLNSKFPMILCWGPDLISFHNDAYRRSLGCDGKFPSLGASGRDVFAANWDFIAPIIDQVRNDGEASWKEDQLVQRSRNGRTEAAYFTFSCSAVYDSLGEIAGVLGTFTETTKKVLQHRTARANERNLRLIILQAPVAIAIFRGPEYVVEIVNSHALELWGKKSADVFNKPIFETIPELKSQGMKELFDHVYYSGDPFIATELTYTLRRKEKKETVYINFVYEPLFDLEGNINGLIAIGTEVTEQVNSRLRMKETAEELQAINEEMLASNEELALVNDQLERAEEMLRFSIEAAGAATWHMETESGTLLASERLKELFGLPAIGEVAYDDVISQIPEEYQSLIKTAVASSIESDERYHMEHPIIGLDGKRRWVRALGKLYPARGIHKKHFSGLIIDITEEKQNELRKNDFIGMVSHELKTPLTSVMGYIQLLMTKMKGNDDAFAYGLLNKTNGQVRKMSAMINGFLNISRLESGTIHIEKTHFQIDELVNEIIEDTRFTVSTHSVDVSLCDRIEVYADRDKIGSVISNLIGNAVKYSPKGGKIEVLCTTVGDGVRFSVADHGIGISQNDLDKLFDRFYRVENPNTKHISGFGIGLYLSAEIVHLHDGKIWATSEPDQGSVFYFSLPLS